MDLDDSLRIGLEMAQKAFEEREAQMTNGTFQSAADAIENDHSLRPFEIGLTAKELVQLKLLSHEARNGSSLKDFLRQVVLDKLEQLKATQQTEE